MQQMKFLLERKCRASAVGTGLTYRRKESRSTGGNRIGSAPRGRTRANETGPSVGARREPVFPIAKTISNGRREPDRPVGSQLLVFKDPGNQTRLKNRIQRTSVVLESASRHTCSNQHPTEASVSVSGALVSHHNQCGRANFVGVRLVAILRGSIECAARSWAAVGCRLPLKRRSTATTAQDCL